jgi:hypothetical protein
LSQILPDEIVQQLSDSQKGTPNSIWVRKGVSVRFSCYSKEACDLFKVETLIRGRLMKKAKTGLYSTSRGHKYTSACPQILQAARAVGLWKWPFHTPFL